MAVLKLGSQAAADELYLAMNGRAFNDLEGDVCWLLFVKEVEFLRAPTQTSTALSAAGTNVLSYFHYCACACVRGGQIFSRRTGLFRTSMTVLVSIVNYCCISSNHTYCSYVAFASALAAAVPRRRAWHAFVFFRHTHHFRRSIHVSIHSCTRACALSPTVCFFVVDAHTRSRSAATERVRVCAHHYFDGACRWCADIII